MTTVIRRLRVWARRHAEQASRRESGMTMVEILMAVAILGIAVVGIVSSLSTASLASDYHRKQALGDTVIKSYAEWLQQRIHSFAYDDCGTAATYNGNTTLLGAWQPEDDDADYSATITNVQYGSAGSPWTFNSGPCTSDQGLQKLSLQVTSSDGRDTETLDLIVRRP